MSWLISLVVAIPFVTTTTARAKDFAAEQLPRLKEKTQEPVGILTTSAGRSVDYKDATNTLNQNLLRNSYFMDEVTHINRERIPERLVHARGSGAFGYFEVTHDISNICRAKFLNEVGKKTPMAVRFSLDAGMRGTAETNRDIRGFAVRFYTEDGNLDLVGLSIPSFAIRDPIFFVPFTHVQLPNPVTNIRSDPNMLWDLITQRPESALAILHLFSDIGIPDGYRHMAGYPIHTFQVENDTGEAFFVRFHYIPDAGIKSLKAEEAINITARDPDYFTRDLYNAIESGNYPTWTVAVQILTLEDVQNAEIDVFDATKILPLEEYPLHSFGRFVLNRNPKNYFAEVESLALCPANLVPGILGSPDKMFEGRLLAYRDAQYYRLGANFDKIPVNCPLNDVHTYNRDGRHPVMKNGGEYPNYYPNTFNGPIPVVTKKRSEILEIVQEDSHDVQQARHVYSHGLSQPEKSRLVQNIITTIMNIDDNIKQRVIKYFHSIHPELGDRLVHSLKADSTST